MTDTFDARTKHREHIQQRTEYVRGKRGPVSYVWGNHVLKPRQLCRAPRDSGHRSPREKPVSSSRRVPATES
jgi:hypothetical protein